MGLKTFEEELHVTPRTNVDNDGDIVDESKVGKVLFWYTDESGKILFAVKWLFENQVPAVEFYPVEYLASLSEDVTDELVYGLEDEEGEEEEEEVDEERGLHLGNMPPGTRTIHP